MDTSASWPLSHLHTQLKCLEGLTNPWSLNLSVRATSTSAGNEEMYFFINISKKTIVQVGVDQLSLVGGPLLGITCDAHSVPVGPRRMPQTRAPGLLDGL